MRKKVDKRIRTLIENGVKLRHRSMFVMIGDKSLNQIENLHYLLSKSVVKSRPTVLWCYRDKLELSSHKKKRAKQVKNLTQRGLMDPKKADSFSLFLETTGITYCQYKDSDGILGNTFGMCILQDFEALTPNLLARTIETVEGGGLILLLIRSLSSLTSLYTMVMDVHERFRTESHSVATGRFNERFLLSMASCKACIVMDDELNILPISSQMKSVMPVPVKEDSEGLSEAERDLKNLKEQLNDDFPVGALMKKCCTLDQGKAVITFLDAILDKTLRSTVALLAGRGRGKSAALGLAIAGAIATGYSNIYVTAPSPENLKTLFQFVTRGFDMLDYKEHLDYDVVQSPNPEFKKATVRINIYKQHRQTIQYVQPHECQKLSQVELLVVDEAAAIPLPVVKSLLGPYLVFLSSTVNGYEGTGRCLSLKLLRQLEEQSRVSTKGTEAINSGRIFKKVELTEAIRYSSGDPIESWLHNLLCLDVTNSIPSINRLPPPCKCDLYYVNRDTLFSCHKNSELFLQRMMALYVASHYKNSPNDLQLMADAPAHHLFVLLGSVNESRNQLPDILCVIQIALEGAISHGSAIRSLSAGHQPSGDQIPWKFCEQFQDVNFPSLSGARIVRIATHPNAMRLKYGSTAVELLTRYFEGQLTSSSKADVGISSDSSPVRITDAAEKASLLEENIKPRTDLPPLLVHLRERRPERLDYLGVSFGLTLDLFRFWKRHKFDPFYISDIPNAVTGEHTCMVLKPLNIKNIEASKSSDWFSSCYQDFRASFAKRLCSPRFNTMDYELAMSLLAPKLNFAETEVQTTISNGIYSYVAKQHSRKRLEAYVNQLVDHNLISDLKLPLADLYFQEMLPVSLSLVEAYVLLCMGLQNQDVSYTEELREPKRKIDYTPMCLLSVPQSAMKLGRQQVLSLFLKVMTELHKCLDNMVSREISSTLPQQKEIELKPHPISLDEDLDEAAQQVKNEMRAKTEGMLNPEFLQRYAIPDEDIDFKTAKVTPGGVVSMKSSRVKIEKNGKRKENHDSGKKRGKKDHGSRSSKKRKS